MSQPGLQPPLVHIVPAGSPAGPNAHAGSRGRIAAVPRRTVPQVAKDIALFAAAPFVTLACLSLFPFIGLAMLVQAWRHRKEAG
jgi:hypothetical protein